MVVFPLGHMDGRKKAEGARDSHTEMLMEVIPMGGEFTGGVGIPEPGSKGLRDGDTLPTEYADTVEGVAAAAALRFPGLGPAATVLAADGRLTPGAMCSR